MSCKQCKDNNNNEQSFSNLLFAPVPETMLTGKKKKAKKAKKVK